MNRIDNLIAGLIGLAMIGAFTLGLAESIGTVPFWIIVVFVLCLASANFIQGCLRNGNGNNRKSK